MQQATRGLVIKVYALEGPMRALALLFFRLIAVAAVIPFTVTAFAADVSSDLYASCRIPFGALKDSKTGEPFPLSAALNESTKLSENLRQRYIVADLNSADENGNCRGVEEYFSPVDELSDFPRLQ